MEHLLAMRGTYTEDRVAYQARAVVVVMAGWTFCRASRCGCADSAVPQAANLAAAGGLAAHAHLRSLRDVFALHPQPAREAVDASACATEEDELRAAWECPVSGARPGRGGVAFSALRPCGHVVATRVLLNVRALPTLRRLPAACCCADARPPAPPGAGAGVRRVRRAVHGSRGAAPAAGGGGAAARYAGEAQAAEAGPRRLLGAVRSTLRIAALT